MEITATPTIAYLIMENRFLDIQTLEFCPYTFALDVLLAGTTNTLNNIVLMILCTVLNFDARK